MKQDDIRAEMRRILDSQAEALTAIRIAHGEMESAWLAHFVNRDMALLDAIAANRAALQLLNRLMNEGIDTP